MAILENIQKDHILQAIKKIDLEGVPKDAQSQQYDLVFGGKQYPPKLVLSYANIFANGSLLDRSSFEGGENTLCFKILRKAGFAIEPKSSDFYPSLQKFLSQATSQDVDLTTKQYPKTFQGLKVKVSFGQGGAARIPWIAFLRNGQSVSKGIYPVYLYFKEHSMLILAYGVSETNLPETKWEVNAVTISEIIQNVFGKNADRYRESLVYAQYKIDVRKDDFGLKKKTINDDLTELISIYNKIDLKEADLGQTSSEERSIHREFKAASDASNLKFSDTFVLRFIASLCTKPFVILTGLAGSGKTKLAQAFANWITEEEEQLCIVPVGADWTSREPLLGFANALDQDRYVRDDHGVVELILNAHAHPEKPYFLILDEMNLSHVERYFADFLSAMESNGYISLHSDVRSAKDGVPSKFKLPHNLFLIGTVNIDETTYMFSPKVLDRSNVIEFRVSNQDMRVFLTNPVKVDLGRLRSKGKHMASEFIRIATTPVIDFEDAGTVNPTLLSFFDELKKVGAEFGYRSASEIYRLISMLKSLDSTIDGDTTIDIAIMQKLLPKLHGSRRKLEPVLTTLAGVCIVDKTQATSVLTNQLEADFDDKTVVRFPITLEKIVRMYQNSVQDGFTSFAEA